MNMNSARTSGKRSRRTWFAIWIAAALILAAVAWMLLAGTSSTVGTWRSAQGKNEYAAAYAETLQRIPAYSQVYDLPTSFGVVRAYRWDVEATRDRTPAVLLPGWASGVPMWGQNITELMQERPVYALDALGDSGLSVQTRPLRDDTDQASWLEQALAGLRIERAHLVGHSFGGWLGANYASRYPKRVVSLSLLEPVRTFVDMRLRIYVRSIPASLPFLPKRWRDGFLKEVGGVSELDQSDPLTRMISAATDEFAPGLPFPSMITDAQRQSWPMPVYVAMGADSAMHDPVEAVRIARRDVRNVQAYNWPGGTHSLPMERRAEIDAAILTFMRGVDAK